MNLICGPNGIGKSTVLESIAATFALGNAAEIKRSRSVDVGIVEVMTGGRDSGSFKLEVKDFHPSGESLVGAYVHAKNIFLLKPTRIFSYTALKAIARDPERKSGLIYQIAQTGIPIGDAKNWFANRFLYSAHADALSGVQIMNLEFSKRCLSILDERFSFHTVQASTNEIIVRTPGGEIYYEYLSSGFKSCISILWGIIRETEFRFPDTKVEDIEGIVLIDEIELHLHPEWQARILSILRAAFPKMQFVISTHSPHVIQSADADTVIALYSVDGAVKRKEMPAFASSFKGWTVEEVLEDVMGMPDTRTAIFNELASEFGNAIDSENVELASQTFRELDALLHPKNEFRKIARLQLASIGVSLD